MTPVVNHLRYVCSRCGAHVRAVVGRASVGGCCTTCGSYDLRPADIVAASAGSFSQSHS